MSWKKYGGLKNLQEFNNITVNNIVTDTFTVRGAFLTVVTIQGDLEVYGNTYQHGDINVDRMTNTKNLTVTSLANIKNLTVNLNADILGDLRVNGIIYLDTNRDAYLSANDHKLGVNKINPEAGLDIYSIQQESLSVYTSQTINKNILARNSVNNGIVFLTDSRGAYIEFYGETGVPNTDNNITVGDSNYVADASINYHYGGILELNAKKYINITSNLVIGNNVTKSQLLNEPIIVHDIPVGTFFYNTYKSPLIKTGNALTLVSNDSSSNTFLNIVSPNKQGAAIGGGPYPVDLSRNMAVFGVLDLSQNFTPSQMIVSGNNLVKCKTTTGFNTFAPKTEKYVVDMNGPVIMTNTEIATAVEPNIQINNINAPKNPEYFNSFVVSVGTPLLKSTSPNIYQTILWTSNNGGQKWNFTPLPNSIADTTQNLIFNGVSVYNNNCALISGNQGKILFSNNGGANWGVIYGYNIDNVNSANLTSLTIVDKNDGTGYQRAYVSYSNYFFYFDFPITAMAPPNYTPMSQSQSYPLYQIFPLFVSTGTGLNGTNIVCDASSNLFCIASNNMIISYPVSNLPTPTGISNSSPGNANTNVTASMSYTYTSTTTGISYKSISVYDSNFAIAVGVNIISYTTNGGQSWTDTPVNMTLNSVRITDSMSAIAVGNTGNILYTNNMCQTWNPLSYDLLNSSGMADRILDKNNNLLAIGMASNSTMILSSVPTNYIPNVSIGTTKLFYIYMPSLFDMQNNDILDICGNLSILGSLKMYGYIHQF